MVKCRLLIDDKIEEQIAPAWPSFLRACEWQNLMQCMRISWDSWQSDIVSIRDDAAAHLALAPEALMQIPYMYAQPQERMRRASK